MRIEAGNDMRSWVVVHGANRLRLKDVVWVDSEAFTYSTFRVKGGFVFHDVHHAKSMLIDEERLLIEIDCHQGETLPPARKAPELPPEVHNTRPINADDCMAAVRAMCKGT